MALWNDTASTERSLFEAATALANLVRQNGNNKSQLIRDNAAQESKAVNAITQDFNKTLQGGIKDINGVLDDKRKLNGFIEGLKEAGATDEIVNSAKQSPTYEAAKEIVGLSLVNPQAMNLGDRYMYKNPLTGETIEGKPDPLDAAVKLAKINAYNRSGQTKPEYLNMLQISKSGAEFLSKNPEAIAVLTMRGLAKKDKDGNLLIREDAQPLLNEWVLNGLKQIPQVKDPYKVLSKSK